MNSNNDWPLLNEDSQTFDKRPIKHTESKERITNSNVKPQKTSLFQTKKRERGNP